jgi:hypothetical protein
MYLELKLKQRQNMTNAKYSFQMQVRSIEILVIIQFLGFDGFFE